MKPDCRTQAVLSAREVHLWRADLDQHMPCADLLEFLCSPDERRCALDMGDPQRRARFVARKGLLRMLLGDYSQRMTPGHEILSSSACARGAALFALGRTTRLGLGLAPVRPSATPPQGIISAEEAFWIACSGDRPRRLATFVAAREACGRAYHDVSQGSLVAALRALEKGAGPVPLGNDGLLLQLVRMERSIACVVHDGAPRTSSVRVLGA